jgi:molybdopterin-biosynthesis enzyme MoeA-like protein
MFNQQIDDAINSEILLVGNELLNGKTRDLNAFWLGKQMAAYGISIIRTTIIRDDLDHIAGVLSNHQM